MAPRGPALYGNEPAEVIDPSPRSLLVVDYSLLTKPVLSVANPSYTYDTDPGATAGFSWNALPGADHYVISVKRPDSSIATSQPIAANKTTYNLFAVRNQLGTMTATLTAYGPAPDNIPIASAPVTYKVTLAKPVMNTPVPNLVYPYLYVPDDPISWTSVKGVDHYQLLIQDPDGIVTTKTVGPAAQITFPNGVYQGDGTKPPTNKTGAAGYKIWVTAEGPAGSGISVASTAVTYLIGPRNPIGVEGTLDAAGSPTLSAPYVLHWINETPGATYRLQLRDITLPAEDVVLDQPNIAATSWNVNTFVKQAHKYAWDVVADLNGRKSSWSAMRFFDTGGQCVPVIGMPTLSALNFKSGAGTAQDPYIIGSTGGKLVMTASLAVNAVPGATDYQVLGEGDGALNPQLSMESGGTPWASGLISAETVYAAGVQARDQFGCWKLGNTAYIFKWTY